MPRFELGTSCNKAGRDPLIKCGPDRAFGYEPNLRHSFVNRTVDFTCLLFTDDKERKFRDAAKRGLGPVRDHRFAFPKMMRREIDRVLLLEKPRVGVHNR